MPWESPVRPWAEWEGVTASNGQPMQSILRKAWLTGNLRYKLNPDQRKVYDRVKASWDTATSSAERLFAFDISRQWGKDFVSGLLAVEALLKCAARNEPARLPYGAPTRDAVKELLVPTLEQLFTDCPPDLLPKELAEGTFRKSADMLTWPGGQRLRFVGLDLHPDRMRGPRSIGFVISEAGFVDDLDYVLTEVVLPQLLHSPEGWGVLNSTPPPNISHSWSRVWLPRLEADGRSVHREIDDNPMLTEDQRRGFIEELGGEDSPRVLRELRARHIPDPTLSVLPEWSDAENIEEREPPKHALTYAALDPGMHHLCGYVIGWYDFEEALLYLRSGFAVPQANTRTVAQLIHAEESEEWLRHITHWNGRTLTGGVYKRVSDTDLRLIADLRAEHGLNFVPTAKDDKESAINSLRLRVERRKLKVHPDAKVVINHLKYGVYKRSGKLDFDESGDYGHFDVLAAAVYLNRNIDAKKNPWPPSGFGFTGDRAFVNKERARQERLERSGVAGLVSAASVIKRQRRRVNGD